MSLVQLARAWIVVATQSVGGGPATLLLMRRELVERHAWITQRQFLEDYALSKMGLGINLVTLAGLIGSRVAGMRGIIVSVAGLVLPAALLTIALTAGYTLVRDSAIVRAALDGAGPVAAGMTAGFAFTLARGSTRRGRRMWLAAPWGVAAARHPDRHGGRRDVPPRRAGARIRRRGMNDPLAIFLIFFRAAALSVGGQGALPLLRQDLAGSGLVTEHQILEALALGRIAPGPTGLYIVTLGYFAAGPLGAAIALVAALVPPVAMIGIAGVLRRQLLNAWAAGVVRGVALSAGGLLVATAIRLLAPDRPILEVPLWQLALAAIGTALAIRGRTHPGLVMGAGALAGLVFSR